MPVCAKCSSPFPYRLRIDGVLKLLQNRKYCLACSPYGKHNTRKLDGSFDRKGTGFGRLTCSRCRREYEYRRSRRVGATRQFCASCNDNIRTAKQKLRAVAYKGGRCERCSYDRCSAALEFHHRDAATKEANPGSLYRVAWARMQAELDKCILLCANCHREEHYRLNRLTIPASVT